MARQKTELKFVQHKSPRLYFFPLLQILDGPERKLRFDLDVPDDCKVMVKQYLDIYTERIFFNRKCSPPPPTSLEDMKYGNLEFW